MNRTTKIILLMVCLFLLMGELAFLAVRTTQLPEVTQPPTVAPTTAPAVTELPTEQPTQAPTEEPTEPPTEAPTLPPEVRYTLTFTGDCTLGSIPANRIKASHFVQTIGENYDYPFQNVRTYFEADDFTMINLEGVLADDGYAASKRFAFRGDTAYTQILTGSSVEAVTLANNHTLDYGQDGYDTTKTVLTEAGVTYVEKDLTSLHTTDSGLVIGLYAASFNFTEKAIRENVQSLIDQGAEVVICAFHWGSEGVYRPSADQKNFAHIAIDAGADIVYGHHPHVLQPIEVYGDGIIYYSLGNFSFGGAVFPQDYDTAVLQQEIIRSPEGEISLGELTIIPCSISSMKGQNNFQPTPLEEGDAYDRVLSKLDGSFTGPDLVVDYSKLDNN